jgi:signal transduction histidine kinase
MRPAQSLRTIISSAQWPAKFGYKNPLIGNVGQLATAKAFLRTEDLPESTALGLVAVRVIRVAEKPLFVMGGQRLDREFLATLELPAGMRVMLYPSAQPTFSPQLVVAANGTIQRPEKLELLIRKVQQTGSDQNEIVEWSSTPGDSESIHTISLRAPGGDLVGILLVGNSRLALIQLERRIRSASLLVGSIGILLAILVSSWASARVTRPVENLAAAAGAVAAGNWNSQVEVTSNDELGELAQAFNRMTRELQQQQERLLQAERVAAWRELARRLAHELKNPLFPLQITVENLLKSRSQATEQFDEVFQESTQTLLAEISNLKTIISRFSEFSKMPQPQLQPVDLNELVQSVLRLHQAQFQADGRPPITGNVQLDNSLGKILADPDLLHRALSNLVLNAIDAMPDGGTLTVRTSRKNSHVCLEVADTGSGLTREECERLFTPYYTTKQHGTGLGLAIVQAVVSDHHGRINVSSTPGHGTTFMIELPVEVVTGAPADAR